MEGQSLRLSLVLLIISILLGALGQICLKRGMQQVGEVDITLATALRVATNILVLLGLGLYGLSSIFWLGVLSRLDLSYSYPLLAINFVLVPLLSQLFLGERVPSLRWLGILVICGGVVLSARS